MKKIIFLAAILVVTISQTNGQTVVPEKVKSAFEQKFADAKRADWKIENETEDEAEWEVSFRLDRKKYDATFSSDGTWIETEYDLKMKNVPNKVKSTLDKEYATYDITEAEHVETPEGIFYEFELETKKEDKEIKIEVLISLEGKVIKEEED